MLRIIRRVLAALFFVCITLLFLDFTGVLHGWLGWMAKIQFLPAVLALNAAVIVGLVTLTMIWGRIYCSIICPLGVFQDIVSRVSAPSKRRRRRFHYTPARTWLRCGVLIAFAACLFLGLNQVAALVAPYSAFGRIANNLLTPIYRLANNGLAYIAERADSYTFYAVDVVWPKSLPTLVVAVLTLVVVVVLAARGGRTYCNTICPVGTVLGFLARFSLLKPVIDGSKCNKCGACERQCKASCINSKAHTMDYSRCVACMNCIGVCHRHAISYTLTPSLRKPTPIPAQSDESSPKSEHTAPKSGAPSPKPIDPTSEASTSKAAPDTSRRAFLSASAIVATGLALHAQEQSVDGGLAVIEDKIAPRRATPITPPGSLGLRNLTRHCTACQLCVAACPNDVLRPSTDPMRLMQPESSYEHGYCRPECNRCSSVCPAGAIRPIDLPTKASTQIGHAVWIRDNCVCITDGVSCGNCARHCPSAAIQMVPLDKDKPGSVSIPVVNTERCIGCGACENLCPTRPFSAIYVEGHEQHRVI